MIVARAGPRRDGWMLSSPSIELAHIKLRLCFVLFLSQQKDLAEAFAAATEQQLELGNFLVCGAAIQKPHPCATAL